VPSLANEESSDDETYIDEEMEDIELQYNDSEEESKSSHSAAEKMQESRIGHRLRPPE
jgi:hypothetical protein